MQILREQQVALEGDAASFNYISKSTDERESLSMVCTDSICRTYEAIQIEDQKSQILRTKKLQKDINCPGLDSGRRFLDSLPSAETRAT